MALALFPSQQSIRFRAQDYHGHDVAAPYSTAVPSTLLDNGCRLSRETRSAKSRVSQGFWSDCLIGEGGGLSDVKILSYLILFLDHLKGRSSACVGSPGT